MHASVFILILLSWRLGSAVTINGPSAAGVAAEQGDYNGYIQPHPEENGLVIQDSASSVSAADSSRLFTHNTVLSGGSSISLGESSLFDDFGAYLRLSQGSTIDNSALFTGAIINGNLELIGSSITYATDRTNGYLYSWGYVHMATFATEGDITMKSTSMSLGVFSDTFLNLASGSQITAPISTGSHSVLSLTATYAILSASITMDKFTTFNANVDRLTLIGSGRISMNSHSTIELTGGKFTATQPLTLGTHSTLTVALPSDVRCFSIAPMVVPDYSQITVSNINNNPYSAYINCFKIGDPIPENLRHLQ